MAVAAMAAVAVQPEQTPLHLRLTEKDWNECFRQLKYAELGVLFLIRTLDPFGDRDLTINIRYIAEQLNLHRTTVSRALTKLEKLQFISLEIETATVRHKVANQRLTLLRFEATPSKTERKREKQRCAPTHRAVRPRTRACAHAQGSAPTHRVVRPRTGSYIWIARAIKLLQTKFKLSKLLSPLPLSQARGEEKKKGEKAKSELKRPKASEAPLNSPPSQANQNLSSQPGTQSRVNIPVAQVEVVPTSRFKPALPDPFFGNRRGGLAYASAIANPYPDGPWLIKDAKGVVSVDPAFTEWFGEYYASKYGHGVAEARCIARKSWENNPQKIAIDWDYYHEWFVQRVAIAALNQENKIVVADEERAKLEYHYKAAVDSKGEMTMPPETQVMLKNSKRTPEQILGMFAPASKTQPIELPAEPNWDAIEKQTQEEEQEYLSQDTYTPPQPASIPEVDAPPTQEDAATSTPPSELIDQIKALKAQREQEQRAKAVALAEAEGELTPDKMYRLNKQLINSKSRKDVFTQAKAERFAASDDFCCDRDQDGLICEIWEASCF